MLYLDTCVLLALLTPEVHSPAASAFLEQAAETVAISPWSAPELHSAGLPQRQCLSAGLEHQPGRGRCLHLAIASGRGAKLCSLDAPFVQAAQQLGLAALLINSVPAITTGCNCP